MLTRSTLPYFASVLTAMSVPAIADDGDAANPSSLETRAEDSLWQRGTLLGDLGGRRKELEKQGLQLAANYIGETLGNLTGGMRRGFTYEGRLELVFNADLEALTDWTGATFHVNAYQIHGQGLSASHIGNLLAVSNIEARPSTRLFDLWLQQELVDGKVSFRAGQLAADDEFVVSQYAANFINSTFGWPGFLGINLPSGGPAYPLATPGFRAKGAPTEELSIAAAIFNGNPAGSTSGDPQAADPSGTSFRLNDGVFAIAEAAYAVNQGKTATGLPAAYRIGGWYHNGRFADQRFDVNGLSLADPRSSGVPAVRQENDGAYLVIDQMVWRVPETSDQGLGVFMRLAAGPDDRNLISVNADAGATMKGLLPGRVDDLLGLGVSYARIGGAARALDRDARAFGAMQGPIRDFEAVVEITYRAQVAPWSTVQPDLQYIIHPGGHVADPRDGARARVLRDALVLGLRTAIAF